MTTKADFTAEEWNQLKMAPTKVAIYMVAADPSIMGVIKEVKATAKFVEESSPPAAARELVTALRADMKDGGDSGAAAAPAEAGEDAVDNARQELAQIVSVIDAKCSPEEAAGFKQWLADAAQAAAEADKEGGFLGIGGKRVSDKEKAALAELDSILKR